MPASTMFAVGVSLSLLAASTRLPPPSRLGGASTYADAGRPPSVSVSEARSAYGTLVIRTRGPSTSPARSTSVPRHRASPLPNTAAGIPSGWLAPRSIE